MLFGKIIIMTWVIDENILFEVNKNLEIKIKQVENSKVVVIDNFYKNPDMVRELILKAPASTWKKFVRNYPDIRQNFNIDMSPLQQAVSNISEKLFKVTLLDDIPFISNIFYQKGLPPGGFSAPHADINYLAALIYLNTPEECFGGTAFYRNRKTGLAYSRYTSADSPVLNKNEFLTESNEDWEFIDLIEMRYNRFVLYRGNIFHNAYIKKEWFINFPRIVQVGFFSTPVSNKTIFFCHDKLILHQENSESPAMTLPNGRFKKITRPYMEFLCLTDGQRDFGDILNIMVPMYGYYGIKEILINALELGAIKFKELNTPN